MDLESNDTWRSCCLVMDPRAVVFFSQLIISLFILSFSASMAWLSSGDCPCSSATATWVGIITLVIGTWLPGPTSGRLEDPAAAKTAQAGEPPVIASPIDSRRGRRRITAEDISRSPTGQAREQPKNIEAELEPLPLRRAIV